MTRIVFNGVEYASPDAMPPAVRTLYDETMRRVAAADAGSPDAGVVVNRIQKTSITVNGRTYDSVDALPPDARRAYEQAMATLGPHGSGASTAAGNNAALPGTGGFTASAVRRGASGSPTFQVKGSGSRGTPWFVGIVLLVALGVLIQWLRYR